MIGLIGPSRRIPTWVKILYSAFVAVMVPYYWHAYGPKNFLFFCDVAVLVTFIGIWTESALLISVEAIAILLPQTLWILDFGSHLAGIGFMGMTDYMFDAQYPLFVRGISLFHGWLPLLILWMLRRVGYDRRAVYVQTAIGMTLLLICFLCFAPPPGPSTSWKAVANINYVYGLSEGSEQHAMPEWAWFAIVLTGVPTLLYLPTHLLLRKFIRSSPQPAPHQSS